MVDTAAWAIRYQKVAARWAERSAERRGRV